jgi:hypothetical protein
MVVWIEVSAQLKRRSMKKRPGLLQEVCRQFRPRGLDRERPIWHATILLSCFLIWLLLLLGWPTAGIPFWLVILWGIGWGIRRDRQCRVLARQPYPLYVRNKLKQDGWDFIYGDSEVRYHPELRRLRRGMNFDRLMIFISFLALLALSTLIRDLAGFGPPPRLPT